MFGNIQFPGEDSTEPSKLITILNEPAPVMEIGKGIPAGPVDNKSSQSKLRSVGQVITGPSLSPSTLNIWVVSVALPQSSIAVQRYVTE